MKAIMIMFDSLNRRMLEPYGAVKSITPNFIKLADRTVKFDKSFIGSMPCMPARRELHTGRYNFLHRSWGPLEPFDDSMPEILRRSGIYSHLVSDHYHYWEDGGATYHNRYSSWQMSRGQEGDPWIGSPGTHHAEGTCNDGHSFTVLQDNINRGFIDSEEKFPQAKTFGMAIDFLERNHNVDNWFLQIETFDPHEPFFVPEEYMNLYGSEFDIDGKDWPPYDRVTELPEEVAAIRMKYRALVSMCDVYLGKILEIMDSHDMWKDTMLIVNTDHGYLLGEHNWWGKCIQPFYNEVALTPLFMHDPQNPAGGTSCGSLVQAIDIPATLLRFFGLESPPSMEGIPLQEAVNPSGQRHEGVLFGIHGGQVNCTDGRWVYMRSPENPHEGELFNYTLMPTHMKNMFSPEELKRAEFVPAFGFSKQCPLLKIPAGEKYNQQSFESFLFDLEEDPAQQNPVTDDESLVRMSNLMKKLMEQNEAPREQFERLGFQLEHN